MNTGWEQLRCAYFHEVCLRTLKNYFFSEGFLKSHMNEIGGVLFLRKECYIEVSYEPETYPRYAPTLVIGIGSSLYDKSLGVTGLPFWFLIPSTNENLKYTFWRFGTEFELSTVLERIKNDIIQPFGPPFWENIEILNNAIYRFRINHV